MSPRRNNSPDLPLAGLSILAGRARQQSSSLSAALKKLGADVIEIPFIEIRRPRSYLALDTALKAISNYDWLILTSVNGVEALSARTKRLGISPDRFQHLRVAAIGTATREEIENLGLKVEVVPERYIAESIVEGLRGKVEGKRVLLARAKVARDVIPRELSKVGAQVDVVEAYETVVPSPSRNRLRSLLKDPKRRPNLIVFTSSSTVRNFFALLGRRGRPGPVDLQGIQFATIGPITSATLHEFGFSAHIEAAEYTIRGLIKAIRNKVWRVRI